MYMEHCTLFYDVRIGFNSIFQTQELDLGSTLYQLSHLRLRCEQGLSVTQVQRPC